MRGSPPCPCRTWGRPQEEARHQAIAEAAQTQIGQARAWRGGGRPAQQEDGERPRKGRPEGSQQGTVVSSHQSLRHRAVQDSSTSRSRACRWNSRTECSARRETTDGRTRRHGTSTSNQPALASSIIHHKIGSLVTRSASTGLRHITSHCALRGWAYRIQMHLRRSSYTRTQVEYPVEYTVQPSSRCGAICMGSNGGKHRSKCWLSSVTFHDSGRPYQQDCACILSGAFRLFH